MATTLQQLLDDLVEQATAPTPSTTIEDVTGALAHLGRAASGLARDGLTPVDGTRQRTAAELGAACAIVGGLWPRTGGPLTDLAGAAADLIGRDRPVMGRTHRWAVTVEVAEAADHCTRLGQRLLPQAAVAELTAVRTLAADIEFDAQNDPPTALGAVMLDRIVPMPGNPRTGSGMTALDAAAALNEALDRGRRTYDLALREFRAAVAAAEITSRCAAAVTVATSGDEPGSLLLAAAAWQLSGRLSMVFADGRRAKPTDPQGVIPWAQILAGSLRADVVSVADIAALRKRDDLPELVSRIQQVANQLPVLAGQLTAVVGEWSRSGRLWAYARDLPPMENMPENRVYDVIVGRGVPAIGADLHPLSHTVGRAAELSSALADALNHAVTSGRPSPPKLANLDVQQRRAPGAAERLLGHAESVARAVAETRSAETPDRLGPGTERAAPY